LLTYRIVSGRLNRGGRLNKGRSGIAIRYFDRRDEPVAAPRQSLDVDRRLGIVAERRANLLDAKIYAVLEVYERAIWPDLLPQFISSDQFARPSGQNSKDLTGLLLQFDRPPFAVQLSALDRKLKIAEANRR
jgi:hypothetical protein